MSDYIPVKYVRNADENLGTGAIRFLDDDRPDINIGGLGVVTEEEFTRLGANGIILDTEGLSDAEREEAMSAAVATADQEATPLRDLKLKDLKSIAETEGADVSGLRSIDDVATAIEEHREATGTEALPATATQTGGGTPALGGGAAGPGGAAAAAGAAGGGPAT